MSVRGDIVKQYAAWTVLSALRRGAPISSKKEIYPLITEVNFSPVLNQAIGNIDSLEFEKWHKNALETAIGSNPKMRNQYGWAAKIINIYLKTYCYVGDAGRSGIRTYLHPPIDSGLWKGIKKRFKGDAVVLNDTHSVTTISGINSHDQYLRLVKGFRTATEKLGCPLIEIEQLWEHW